MHLLKPVGILKDALKRRFILDGDIANNYDAAISFLIQKAKEMVIAPV